jgi:hypothetical protein
MAFVTTSDAMMSRGIRLTGRGFELILSMSFGQNSVNRMQQRSPPWHETFSQYALTFFMLAMGTMIGACLAVYFGEIRMQVELANMLGGILGALVGALGAGLIAIWLYQKGRFDKLRPIAAKLLRRCEMTELALNFMPDHLNSNMETVSHWIDKFVEEHTPNEGLALGATINQLLEEIFDRIKRLQQLMSTEEFDAREPDTVGQIRGTASQVLERLSTVKLALASIASSD